MLSGKWITENRLERGYTCRDLGYAVGLYEYEIARLEMRGEFKDDALERKLCKAFGLPESTVTPEEREIVEVYTREDNTDDVYLELREMLLSLNVMGQFLVLVKAAELSGEPAYNKAGELDAARTKGYLSLIYREFLRLQQESDSAQDDLLERLFRAHTE